MIRHTFTISFDKQEHAVGVTQLTHFLYLFRGAYAVLAEGSVDEKEFVAEGPAAYLESARKRLKDVSMDFTIQDYFFKDLEESNLVIIHIKKDTYLEIMLAGTLFPLAMAASAAGADVDFQDLRCRFNSLAEAQKELIKAFGLNDRK